MSKKYRVIITADYNDADYVLSDYEITQHECFGIKGAISRLNVYSALEKPKPVYQGRHNWQNHKDKLYKDEKAIIEKFLPNSLPYDECEIHTIKSVKLFEIAKEEELIK